MPSSRNVTDWPFQHLPRPRSQIGLLYCPIMAIIDTLARHRPEPRHWQGQYSPAIKPKRRKWAIMAVSGHFSRYCFIYRVHNPLVAHLAIMAINDSNNDPFSSVKSATSALRARDYLHTLRRKWLRIRELLARLARISVPPLGSVTRSSRGFSRAATYTTLLPSPLPAPFSNWWRSPATRIL